MQAYFLHLRQRYIGQPTSANLHRRMPGHHEVCAPADASLAAFLRSLNLCANHGRYPKPTKSSLPINLVHFIRSRHLGVLVERTPRRGSICRAIKFGLPRAAGFAGLAFASWRIERSALACLCRVLSQAPYKRTVQAGLCTALARVTPN